MYLVQKHWRHHRKTKNFGPTTFFAVPSEARFKLQYIVDVGSIQLKTEGKLVG